MTDELLDIRIADRQPENVPLRPERLAPHSIDAEEALLGSILLNNAALAGLDETLNTDDFFIRKHAMLWGAFVAMRKRGDAIDDLTLIAELEKLRVLDRIGGASFITRLIANTPTYINAETYARMVSRAATRRRLIDAASKIVQAAQDEMMDIYEVRDKALTEINQASRIADTRPALTAAQYADQAYQETVDRADGVVAVNVPTRLGLDGLLIGGGLAAKQLVIVGARPGNGKSTIAAHLAYQTALDGKWVSLFSNEMGGVDIARRILSAIATVPYGKLASGKLDADEWSRYTKAKADADSALRRIKIHTVDDNANTTAQIAALCRKERSVGRLNAIIVDYLGLLEPTEDQRKADNRANQVGMMTRALKLTAGELDVPLVCCAQINRDPEKRADKRPTLADLRESGSVENDADVVILTYLPFKNEEHTTRPDEMDLILAKQRNGPTGTVAARFNVSCFLLKPIEMRPLSAPVTSALPVYANPDW